LDAAATSELIRRTTTRSRACRRDLRDLEYPRNAEPAHAEEQQEDPNGGRFQPTRRGSRAWLLWLLILLFPIPFTPWWLGLILLLVFMLLLWLLAP